MAQQNKFDGDKASGSLLPPFRTYLVDESSLVAGKSCSVEFDILRLIYIARCVLPVQ